MNADSPAYIADYGPVTNINIFIKGKNNDYSNNNNRYLATDSRN